MKLIDMHTHVYPDMIAAKAAQNIRDYYHLGENMDGTISTLLRQGTAAGVMHYLILPVAVKPEHVKTINNFPRQQVQAHDCFTGFGTVHAAMENKMEEVKRLESMGLKGIKIHPDCQRFHIDDTRMFPVYEEVQGRLPMMIHLGDENFDYSHPARLRKVLRNFPQLEVCAAHFGGHTMYETAKECLSDTNCILDISSTLMFLDKKTAEGYVNHYGAERLAFGTDYEYFNAVWVKNEWSRYLKLMEKDKGKHLIPCYKGIDAYDIPKEFVRLQAQDLGKVGAVQDLVRGIEKLIGVKQPSENVQAVQQVVMQQTGPDCESLLKRAFMFLEDGDFESADEYCEKVLDVEPECAQAYLGKLMVKLKVHKVERLADCEETFTEEQFYKKIIRFADENLKNQLETYNEENECYYFFEEEKEGKGEGREKEKLPFWESFYCPMT